jgi:hypothetical protein
LPKTSTRAAILSTGSAFRSRRVSPRGDRAAFFVSVNVVKQRLKLASVLPKLLDAYAEDGMTLDQLMAFTVSGDHERQEQVTAAEFPRQAALCHPPHDRGRSTRHRQTGNSLA